MITAETAGPCIKCGSDNTKRTILRPPVSSKGTHRCTPECDKPFRLCLNCRVATPMEEETVTYVLSDDMFGRAVVIEGDPFDDMSPYVVGDDVGPKFANVAAAIMHEWSLDTSNIDEQSGDAQYGNGWHALFRTERAILQTVNSGACYAWRVPDNANLDVEWEKIEAGAVYPDDPDPDNEE